MGAYYQNQVVSLNPITNNQETFIQKAYAIKFLESQFVLNNTFINTIKRLSTHTNASNPAKVYCVCDYDEIEHEDDTTQPFACAEASNHSSEQLVFTDNITYQVANFNGDDDSETIYASIEIPNAIMVTDGISVDTKHKGFKALEVSIEGVLSGFVVNKDKDEFINVDVCVEVARYIKDYNNGHNVISPLALLTRKNKGCVGSGDLQSERYEQELFDIMARWYGDNVYWTSDDPSEFAIDITKDHLWVFAHVPEDRKRDDIDPYLVSPYSPPYDVVPLFSKMHDLNMDKLLSDSMGG